MCFLVSCGGDSCKICPPVQRQTCRVTVSTIPAIKRRFQEKNEADALRSDRLILRTGERERGLAANPYRLGVKDQTLQAILRHLYNKQIPPPELGECNFFSAWWIVGAEART